MISKISMLLLSLFLLACTSVKVVVKKPNFEKVQSTKGFIVFPLKSLTIRENEFIFDKTIKPATTDKILVHHEPSMEWELKRLGVALEDTATYYRLENAGYGYLLFFRLTSMQNADLWEHYSAIELGNRYETSSPYIEPQADKKLEILLQLYSVKSKQFIYENIVKVNKSATRINDNKGGVHFVSTGSLYVLHRKAIEKGLNRMFEDCDL